MSEPSAVVQYWLDEIAQTRKRERDYRKTGREVLKIYESDKEESVPFNILYSNTETLLPSLYSTPPRPVVQRRFKDADPMGKLAADAAKRMLESLLDTNREGYESFHEAMESGTLDALLPGRGMIALKYDATFGSLSEPRPPDPDDTNPPEEDNEIPDAESTYATSELICPESLVWDRIYVGYAKKWQHVPWIAYEFYLSKEEVAQLLDETIAAKLTYTVGQPVEGRQEDDGRRESKAEQMGQRKTACVYQIWDKAGGKKVRYVSPSYTDAMLKEEDDPLGLTGFFNTPRPLCFIKKSANLIPTAPYQMYRTQAQELNRIQQRINRIVEAIKARGIYDGSLGEAFAKIMEQDDNTLIPAEIVSSLATEKGFQNAIWFLPIEVLAAVLVQLYQARESAKQVVYEITGISDIIRGTSQASETATAQNIKNRWGALRLRRLQSDVARYARDLLRLMLELAATKFSEETWASMTGLPFITTMQSQQLQQQAQQIAMMGQPVPTELQQQLQQPVWGAVLQLLKDDNARSFRIDIETNSTVEPEAAEDYKNITELFTALGQVMNGMVPLVVNGSLPFEAMQSMLLVLTRHFRWGPEIEDQLKLMKPPQPKTEGPDPAVMKQQQQMAEQSVQMKQKEAEGAVKMKAMDAEMQHKQREMDLQMRELELSMKEHELGRQHEAQQQSFEMTKQSAQQELGTQQKVAQLENTKYKTENVVNQKADTALGQGVKALQALVGELVKAMAHQSAQNQQLVETVMQALPKPKKKAEA